ncbi:MAG: zinc ribbon domain-containing protein [Thermoflexales bacterium]|nr:zinc ribbon domain-containing protein [Thermoflexales bacterium]
MKCQVCGADNPPGAKFCSQCGERLAAGASEEAWLHCARCGRDNPPGSRFCGACGAPLALALPPAAHAELTTAAPAELLRPAPAQPPTPIPSAQPTPSAAELPSFYFVSSSGAPIYFPPRPDRVWVVGREDPVSGIYPDVDLSPYDPERTVSRRHAEIAQTGSAVVLTSLTTTNWTKVNNVKIPANRPVVLRDGDQIEFARCVIMFHLR